MTSTAPPGSLLPLTARGLDEIVFWRGAAAVRCARFLGNAQALAARLPDRPYAVNLCRDRYHFLVAFAAALLCGQVSLLTSDRSPHRLRELAQRYPGAYALGDDDEVSPALPQQRVTLDEDAPAWSGEVPAIAAERVAALVFTSGSTGEPVANAKPWHALVACTEAAAERFGWDGPVCHAIIGTVPPQHMYGFETTVLMPLHGNVASYAGDTFFPPDLHQALRHVAGPRVLVTTPLQLRALLAEPAPIAELDCVISATAPLAIDLAAQAERAWGTRVFEIFGATEMGSIASRRTVAGDTWQTYRSVGLRAEGDGAAALVRHLPHPVPFGDTVELLGGDRFRLIGRKSDLVKIAGKRASLAGLNQLLCEIDGVEDGVFVVPDDLEDNPVARLIVYVVAPSRSAGEIMEALRQRIEAPFLPRRLLMVSALPRNGVGKLPHSALAELQRRVGES